MRVVLIRIARRTEQRVAQAAQATRHARASADLLASGHASPAAASPTPTPLTPRPLPCPLPHQPTDNFLLVTKVKRESAREAARSYCDGDPDEYSAASDSGGSDPEQLLGASNIVPAGCLSVWKYITRKDSAFCAGAARWAGPRAPGCAEVLAAGCPPGDARRQPPATRSSGLERRWAWAPPSTRLLASAPGGALACQLKQPAAQPAASLHRAARPPGGAARRRCMRCADCLPPLPASTHLPAALPASPAACPQDFDSPVKATDFGLSIRHRPEDPPLKSRSGTPAYMAPEVGALSINSLLALMRPVVLTGAEPGRPTAGC